MVPRPVRPTAGRARRSIRGSRGGLEGRLGAPDRDVTAQLGNRIAPPGVVFHMRRLGIAVLITVVMAACGGAGAAAPSTTATPIRGAVLITRAHDRGTVPARVGDTIQIALGTEYEWRVDPPDGVVLTRGVQNQLLVRGTQALWHASAPGTATVTATGTVICPSGQACIMIAILFTVTVVVSP